MDVAVKGAYGSDEVGVTLKLKHCNHYKHTVAKQALMHW